MYKALVSAKGRIVIPSALRKKFGVKKGAQVCVYERGGEIIIKPITDEYIQSLARISYFILTPISSPDKEVAPVDVWKVASGPAEMTQVTLVLPPTRVEALI